MSWILCDVAISVALFIVIVVLLVVVSLLWLRLALRIIKLTGAKPLLNRG